MQTVTAFTVPMFHSSPKYLVDTDWIVHYLRGKHGDIVSRLLELVSEGLLAVSIISVAELYHGVYKSTRPEENLKGIENFFSDVEVLTIGEGIAKRFGREKVALHNKRTPIDGFDLFIGCTALEYGLILLTNNIKHYKCIEGLKIESL